MNNTLNIIGENWSYGSYIRRSFRFDIIYTILQYKEMDALFNLNIGKLSVKDRFADQMLEDQIISPEMKRKFELAAMDAMEPLTRFDNAYIEDIYGVLHKTRKSCFGPELIEEEQRMAAEREIFFDSVDGIDQTGKKETLLASCKSVIFALTDASLFSLMKKDVQEALHQGKDVYIVTSREVGDTIPCCGFFKTYFPAHDRVHYLKMMCRNGGLNFKKISFRDKLQKEIDAQETFLIVYGEDGFLSCRSLLVDSIVYGVPSGYFTKTVTNQHESGSACVVYVPKNFDIIRWVGIWSRTRASYQQLSRIWEAYGDDIYKNTIEELYLKYPQYFINTYSTEKKCAEAAETYPIRLEWDAPGEEHFVFQQFDYLKDKAIREYLNSFDNIHYESAYFTEEMKRTEIPWFANEQQKGILVHAVRLGNVKNSYIADCNGKTVREVLKEDKRSSGDGLKLLSNFLFFLTPRLAQLYNELRKDRVREQIHHSGGHLDYSLYYQDGRRIETFPLFKKSCVGMMKNGQYLFFNYELGGGTVTLNGEEIRWGREDVNCELPKAVAIYSPSYAKEQEGIDDKAYFMPVGQNRVNIVMAQGRILCIRRGDVGLSPIGVVLSIEEEQGLKLLDQIGAKPVEDGYYTLDNCELSVKLDKPDQIAGEEWDQILWVYGGGLSLILNGVGLCDGMHMESWLEQEGWMSVMSKQTQESAIHKMAKHPRTGVGVTKDGDLVIMVYSGRTSMSTGADYEEMIQIARKLFPDIWSMMNVDGGGSSVLGLVVNNSFMELSYPATSANNCAGMVRPINTILCVEP